MISIQSALNNDANDRRPIGREVLLIIEWLISGLEMGRLFPTLKFQIQKHVGENLFNYFVSSSKSNTKGH
jgi:hypothetical protein